MSLSKRQIDRLGDQLRSRDATDEDVRLLEAWRREFVPAFEFVTRTLRESLSVDVKGRPEKSILSIVEKLRRESLRLSQMQDIAGCRVFVADTTRQDELVAELMRLFAECRVVDRRERSSHGYRAVHVLVRHEGRPVEIQVRTRLQHFWAELCERLADRVDRALKYGGGPTDLRDSLDRLSTDVARLDRESGSEEELPAKTEGLFSNEDVVKMVERSLEEP